MSTDNQTTLVGHLTRDFELKALSNGTTVGEAGLAVNRSWKNKKTGEWEEKVSFFDLKAFGALADNAYASVGRGAHVMVIGRLDQQTWEKDGAKRSKIEIVLDHVGPSLAKAIAVPTKAGETQRDQESTSRNGIPDDYDDSPF